MFGVPVDRRTGGLEIKQIEDLEQSLVDRRTGGLENLSRNTRRLILVDRRTGGLEMEHGGAP